MKAIGLVLIFLSGFGFGVMVASARWAEEVRSVTVTMETQTATLKEASKALDVSTKQLNDDKATMDAAKVQLDRCSATIGRLLAVQR